MPLEEVITEETMRIHTVTDVMYECNACFNSPNKIIGSLYNLMVPCVISFRWIGVGVGESDVKDICLKRTVEDSSPLWVEKYREEIQVEI